ncbi:glycosyltransferase [Miltoncostaea oceani]|uniref:glycosyltransferase n=1 Tax=Miltoncostaea oceani TaxID=2843216 RepID=UPI002484824C|nr:glycosyltransferase family 2 protein [Miltoncostaea oceani]
MPASDGTEGAADPTVVVLNWRTTPMTVRSVRALGDAGIGPDRVVVVDNGSGTGAEQELREALPGCRILALPENLGYARASNLGAALDPGAPAYLFVNSDAFARGRRSITALTEALSRPGTGVAVPRLLDEGLTLQPSVRPFPGPTVALLRATGLERLVPDRRRPGLGSRWTHDRSRTVDFATGAVMMVRGDVWRLLGGFSETGFFYGEDMDLCWRARQRGWDTWFAHDSEWIHLGEGSSRHAWDDAARWERIGRAEARVIRAHRSPASAELTLALLRAGLSMRARVWRIARQQARAAAWTAQARGYSDRCPDPRGDGPA